MKRTVRLAEAVQRIRRSPAPLICLDTCCLLDLIRAPIRREIPNRLVTDAQILVQKARAKPRGLWIIIARRVTSEWQRNLARVEQELITHIKRIDQEIASLGAAVREILWKEENYGAIAGPPGVSPARITANLPRFGDWGFVPYLRGIGESLFDAGLAVDGGARCRENATNRRDLGKPPADPAYPGEGYDDCEIIETYLALCMALRRWKFAKPCVFVSSNVKDYGEQRKARLNRQLVPEFRRAGLVFVTNLAWGHSHLFGPSLTRRRS